MCSSLPTSPSARTRPRKRKQPVPSHVIRSKPLLEPLLEPSLDDALLSAANARIRSGRLGRRPARNARAGPGTGSAGPSPKAPSGQTDASEPNQALLAASARLAAETRSPRLPRPRSAAAGRAPGPAVQTTAAAPGEAPQSPPFWHLPPVSPPQPMHASASQPPLAPSHNVEAPSAVLPASQSRVEARQASSGHDTALGPRQKTATERAEGPQCRKWLDFSSAAHKDSPQPLQPGASADSWMPDSVANSTGQGVMPAGVTPPTGQGGVRQQHSNGAPAVQEQPGQVDNNGTRAQTSHPASVGQAIQGKGGDAELVIGGVLTRWTKVRDTSLPDTCVCTCEQDDFVSQPIRSTLVVLPAGWMLSRLGVAALASLCHVRGRCESNVLMTESCREKVAMHGCRQRTQQFSTQP